MQQRGEGEVRVAGRVGAPKLGAGGLLPARPPGRYPDERAAIAPAPRDVHRRLVPRNQSLVRVDPLREHARQLACMAQLPGDKRLAHSAQQVLVIGVIKGILATAKQALVGVHSRPVLTHEGLGHKGGVDAISVRHLLHHRAVGHHVVGHTQGIIKSHVDLVLRRPHLVVGVLHGDTHGLERQHGFASQVAGRIEGGQIEIPTAVEGLGVVGCLEVEVLKLGADEVMVKAHGLRPVKRAAQDLAGVALVRLAIRHADVAEHARNALHLGAVGQHSER